MLCLLAVVLPTNRQPKALFDFAGGKGNRVKGKNKASKFSPEKCYSQTPGA
jgi:hypothetical protein